MPERVVYQRWRPVTESGYDNNKFQHAPKYWTILEIRIKLTETKID